MTALVFLMSQARTLTERQIREASGKVWGVELGSEMQPGGNWLVEAAKVAALASDPSADVQLQVAIASRKIRNFDALPALSDVLTHCGQDKLIPAIAWNNLHPLLEANGTPFVELLKLYEPRGAPKAGSAGDSPASVGDLPTGSGKRSPSTLTPASLGQVRSIPPGGSPGGTGQWPVPRNQVKYTRVSKLSMMPEGIEALLDKRDLADLFAFLALDKPPTNADAKLIPGAPK